MAIKELKKHNATTRSTPPPKRAVNTHDTDPHPEQTPLTLPQVIQPLQIPLQTLIWTTLNPVKPSPLMTLPLSTSWTHIPLLTLSIKPTSTMCLNTLLPIMVLLLMDETLLHVLPSSIPIMAKWFSSCMNMPIMVEATPSTIQVKLNGSRTPVMTSPSMWEGNKLSPSLMAILLLSSVGQVSCI